MDAPPRVQLTLDNLPREPGVYRLKSHTGEVLYVGKSKNLRDRVRTYFQGTPPDRKVAHLRARTKEIDFLVLASDRQAQEVEWDLIRHHGPPYNTLYLDYWNHPYIKLTVREPYPRIELTQKRDDPDAEYYGPYKNTQRLRDTLVALRETLPLRDCELEIPPGGDAEQFETCMEYELDRCTAPCVGYESVESYRERLEPVRSFLDGNYSKVDELLESRMKQEARNHNYEAAALYRDRREAVQNMINYEPFLRETLRRDIWACHGQHIVYLGVREHRLKKFRVQEGQGRDPRGYIRSYYQKRDGPAPDIVLHESLELISGDRGFDGTVRRAKTDEESRLARTARRTARHHEEVARSRAGTDPKPVVDRVTVRNQRLVVERSFPEDTERTRRKAVRRPENGLRDTVLPMYRNDLDSGRILPSELRVQTPNNLRLSVRDLWTDCPFWFPIFLEGK